MEVSHMFLGEFLKAYREKHNMSMQELANLAGISKSYISLLEKVYNPKTNQPYQPTIEKMHRIAIALGMELDELLKILDEDQPVIVGGPIDDDMEAVNFMRPRYVKIPLLGTVVAGAPVEAIEDILDYEEIPETLARKGEFFALQVKGDSMAPELTDGDVVIVQKQSDVNTGDIAVVLINGEEATIKEVKKYPHGIELVGRNPLIFPTRGFTNIQIETLPVEIIGRVIEARRRY